MKAALDNGHFYRVFILDFDVFYRKFRVLLWNVQIKNYTIE